MQAMILAAGRGERMRPLSDYCPKPLLAVAGEPLIARHLRRLAMAGCRRVVVNIAWLGARLRDYLGDGSPWGMEVVLSDEGDQALETAGGIARALPLLGPDPFWVINGDIWTDFDLATLPREPEGLGHLILVDNPAHHPQGDFCLQGDAVVAARGDGSGLTFAGVACYRPELFAGQAATVAPLAPILRRAAARRQLTGWHYPGAWFDVGTPRRLAALEAAISAGQVQP